MQRADGFTYQVVEKGGGADPVAASQRPPRRNTVIAYHQARDVALCVLLVSTHVCNLTTPRQQLGHQLLPWRGHVALNPPLEARGLVSRSTPHSEQCLCPLDPFQEETNMPQTQLAPRSEKTILPHSAHRRTVQFWRPLWVAFGAGTLKSVSLVLVVTLLLAVLVGLGASATALGVGWSSLAWEPLPPPSVGPLQVAPRVRPIIQADSNAGYDSQEQHDVWWDSVCSAAAFTEVAHAWGIANVRIGQVLDRLLAHDPPYITVSGGLMSPLGWPWMAAAYHLQTQIAWNAFTFESLVQRVLNSGIPMIIGMDGGNPSDPWGHYVVVVGGDSAQASIVDSSSWRMHSLPRAFFNGPTPGIINDPIWWTGETILLTPA